MTYKCAEYFGDLDNEYLTYKLQDFAEKFGMKHTPSVVAVKAIASRLAMKQRKRTGFDLEITNESKAQIHAKTGWSEGTIGDVIKFLEWMGLMKTIRRGGGKNRLPTVRHMITTGPPIQFQSKHDGIIDVHNGRPKKHDGIKDDQNGELPDTPRDIPMMHTQCVYVHESFTSRNIQTSKEEEKNKHKSIRIHLDACEDESDCLKELNSLAEEDSGYLSLLLELNDPFIVENLIASLSEPALSDELMARLSGPDLSDDLLASLSGDVNLESLIEASDIDVSDDLDEYSVTPDDVKDLMARW